MAEPLNKITCVKNLWLRQMFFINAGDFTKGHSHTYDHVTLLAHGSVRIVVDGESTDFTAPHMIYIQAEKLHDIEALEDGTVAYCVHALRDSETHDIIDPDQIPLGINPNDVYSIAPIVIK
jgi:triacylglycerol esterase/lipase EstA (alpha/beta hydrolase family)